MSRANGRTSEAIASLLYEETLTAAEYFVIQTLITPITTWALKPAANTVADGTVLKFSDIGENGSMWASKSSTNEWHPVGGRVVLQHVTVGVPSASSVAEQVLGTVTLPAGILGLNGQFSVNSRWSFTNNANIKTFRVRLGGAGGTILSETNRGGSAGASLTTTVTNRASASSQLAAQSVDALATTPLATAAINTAVAADIVLSIQKATAGDVATLETLTVELLYK